MAKSSSSLQKLYPPPSSAAPRLLLRGAALLCGVEKSGRGRGDFLQKVPSSPPRTPPLLPQRLSTLSNPYPQFFRLAERPPLKDGLLRTTTMVPAAQRRRRRRRRRRCSIFLFLKYKKGFPNKGKPFSVRTACKRDSIKSKVFGREGGEVWRGGGKPFSRKVSLPPPIPFPHPLP